MSYHFETEHAFIALSKRKPYVCGSCLRDIAHQVHQLTIEGVQVAPAPIRYREHGEETLALPFAGTQISLF